MNRYKVSYLYQGRLELTISVDAHNIEHALQDSIMEIDDMASDLVNGTGNDDALLITKVELLP